jgi:hypothetical protein
VLSFPADLEALKDDQEDEEIVHAERGFNGIAAYPFKRRLPALSFGDPDRKRGCSQHESRRSQPRKSLGVARFAAMAREEGIHQQQRSYYSVKPQPPRPGCAGNHFWMV